MPRVRLGHLGNLLCCCLGLVFFLPLGVGHAIDVLARSFLVQRHALFVGRVLQPAIVRCRLVMVVKLNERTAVLSQTATTVSLPLYHCETFELARDLMKFLLSETIIP